MAVDILGPVPTKKPTLYVRGLRKQEARAYNIYERGQIWWWKDPVYGDKKDGVELPIDRGRVTYSRSVLLLQDPITINGAKCAIVVPLSRSSKSGIEFEFQGNVKTYINCSSITTIHLDNLSRYMAKASEELMSEVARAITYYILPNTYNQLSEGSQLNVVYENDVSDPEPETFEPEPVDPVLEGPPEIPIKVDIVDYLKSKASYDTPILNERLKRINWTKEEKQEFVKTCSSIGIENASTAVGLTKATAENYFYKFRKELADLAGTPLPNPPGDVTITIPPMAPQTIGAQTAVSKLSNNIREYYQQANILEQVKKYFRSQKKIFPADFYDQFGNAVYKSLIKFLGIVENRDELTIPQISTDNPHLDTWVLLEKIFSDPVLGSVKKGEHLVQSYRKVYSTEKGISPDWLVLLRKEISNKTSMMPVGSEYLAKVIGESWCSQPQSP